MASTVGRASFKVVHGKTGGKFPREKGSNKEPHGSNAALIKEALRSLDPVQSKIEAGKNANIVLADEALNENWVNDGNGGMKTATSFQEPLDYLASRNAQLFRAQAATDMELTALVVHLPENLCVEDPDNVSFVYDKHGEQVISAVTGEPLTKPRLIPRDPAEAKRYFDDAVEFLIEQRIITGGADALHWRSDQYSEHRPHMQLGFDNYAADPKHPGKLRNNNSRVWYSSRDVRYPDGHAKAGQMIGEKVKMSDYHARMRAFMIDKGWKVEADIDPKMKGNSQGKDLHAATDNARLIAEDRLAAVELIEIQTTADLQLVSATKKRNDDRAAKLDQRESSLAQERASFETEKADAADAINGAQAVAQRLREDAELDAEAMKSKARSILDQAEAVTAETREMPMAFEAFLAAPTSAKPGAKTFGDYYERFEAEDTAKRAKAKRTRQQLLRELTTTESDGFTPPTRHGLGD